MVPKTFRFTKKAIADIPAHSRLVTYHDTVARGLKLQVRPSGTKAFIFYRKIAGKPERITIGRFPDLSVEQARGKANGYNAQIAMGKNPARVKQTLRQEMTLGEFFESFLTRYAKVHKKSWKEDQKLFRLYLQRWSKRKLSHIVKSDVQQLHTDVGENNGIYVANRMLALLQTLFNRAIDLGLEQPNPAKGVKKFKEQSRDRFLQADELPRLFRALETEPNDTIRDYVLMSLLTGARKSNVVAMRWDQLNFDRKTWTIPMTKNGEGHTVPLVKPAMDILKARQLRSQSPWVFPGCGATGHLVEPKKAWKKILERAGIENLRLHDLRRSLGSWQAATGASLTVIGKTLAHKNVSTTAIYARLGLEPVRASMDKATQAMLKTVAID